MFWSALAIEFLWRIRCKRVVFWYHNEKFELDRIDLDSVSIENVKIESLVLAMAAFGKPQGGEISLSDDERQSIDSAIAVAWQ